MGTTAKKLAHAKAVKADLKAALTEKGQNPGDVFDTFPDLVRAIETGTKLPDLTNPGAAADLRKGKQLIDQAGQIVNGTLDSSGGDWEIVFFSTDSRYPSSDVFSGEYENDLENNGFFKMNLRSGVYISEYQFLSVCAVYDDYLLTLMVTEIPEPLRQTSDVKLGAYRYDEDDDMYYFNDFVQGYYSHIGDYFSLDISGTHGVFSPDHVYAYIAIKRS